MYASKDRLHGAMTNRSHTVTACILAVIGLYILRLNSIEIQPNAEGALALNSLHYHVNKLANSPLPVAGTAIVTKVLGESPIAVRLFTVACSALALFLTYLIGRRFVSYKGAMLALCFVASAMPWAVASRHANPIMPLTAFMLCTAWLLMERKWLYAIPSLVAMMLCIPTNGSSGFEHIIAIAIPPIAIGGMLLFEKLMKAGRQRELLALYGALLAGASTIFTSGIVVSISIFCFFGVASLLFSKKTLTELVIRGYKPVLYLAVSIFFVNVALRVWFGSASDIRGGMEVAATLAESGSTSAVYLHHAQDADNSVNAQNHDSTVNEQLRWYTKERSNFTVATLPTDSADVGIVAEVSAAVAPRVVYYHPHVSSETVTTVQAAFAPLYDVALDLPHYTLFTLR